MVKRRGFLLVLRLLLCLLMVVSARAEFAYAETATPTPTDTPAVTPTLTPTVTVTPGPTPTPTPDTSQVTQLQQQISDLENKISDLQSQDKTLSSQIAVMDNQIELTQLRINSTKQQITDLTTSIGIASKKVNILESSLNDLIKVLLNRVIATYENGSSTAMNLLFASGSISDFIARANYLRIAQDHDKQLIYNTQQTKSDYANQKSIFEDEKRKVQTLQTQLLAYTSQLDQQKQAKQALLDQTKNSEASYQQQLTQAQAQLAAFSNFVDLQGGASILSNQTVCNDGWNGCYYNQRDSQWGNLVINGSNDCGGSCSVARVGCLITSVAMVASHKGHKEILPSSIAISSGDNFAVGTAELRFSISINGVSIQRNSISLPSTITDPVIVGISYDNGPLPDHFVVLISGSNGNYKMNDPYIENGHNISFTDHYSLSSIREVDSVSM